MTQEWDTHYTDLVACPYCGFIDKDSWEIDEEGEWYCNSCGKRMFVSIHTSVKYSTRKVEDL